MAYKFLCKDSRTPHTRQAQGGRGIRAQIHIRRPSVVGGAQHCPGRKRNGRICRARRPYAGHGTDAGAHQGALGGIRQTVLTP